MIELNVEGYCHGCPRFEPVVNRTYNYSNMVATQTVTCEHRNECVQMVRYLERKIEKELEDA